MFCFIFRHYSHLIVIALESSTFVLCRVENDEIEVFLLQLLLRIQLFIVCLKGKADELLTVAFQFSKRSSDVSCRAESDYEVVFLSLYLLVGSMFRTEVSYCSTRIAASCPGKTSVAALYISSQHSTSILFIESEHVMDTGPDMRVTSAPLLAHSSARA